MLTGRVPFDAESAVTIALKHVSEAPPADDRVQPGGPARARAGRDVGAEQEPRRPPRRRRPVHHRARAGARRRSLRRARAAHREHGRAGRRGAPGGTPRRRPRGSGVAAAAPPTGTDTSTARTRDRCRPRRRATPAGGAGGRGSWRCSCCCSPAAEWRRTCSPRPEKVVVPGVVGEDLNTARTQLQNAGFTVGSPIQVTGTQKAGTVIAQDPAGGNEGQGRARRVSLTVSSGPGNGRGPHRGGRDAGPGQVVDRDSQPHRGQGGARVEHPVRLRPGDRHQPERGRQRHRSARR